MCRRTTFPAVILLEATFSRRRCEAILAINKPLLDPI
jgi:hypothetical protein